MKAKREITIRIHGTISGPIWWPVGEEYSKEFDERFSYDSQPFATQIDCLRDALLHITNDGDFQHASIQDAVMEVSHTYWRYNSGLVHDYWTKERTTTRYRELVGTGYNSDLFCEEVQP